MSDTSQGDGWWIASDDKWYAPEQHPDYVPPSTDALVGEPSIGGGDTSSGDETALITPDPAATTPGPAFTPPTAPTTHTPAADAPALHAVAHELAPPAASVETSTRSNRSLILGIGALVLVAGLGFLAFRLFAGGSNAGGASSPETAIEQLIASVNERDAIGLAELVDPDELEAWVGSFTPAFDSFEGLAGEDNSTDEAAELYGSLFESFEYTLTGIDGQPVTYDVEPLDDKDRISRVRLDGIELTLSAVASDETLIVGIENDLIGLDLSVADGAKVSFEDDRFGLAATLLLPGEPPNDEYLSGAHLDFVTVQKDGKWYISIGYSLLEIARNQGGFDDIEPNFGRGYDLVENQTGGSESPEQAIRDMFLSLEDLDYNAVIELTDPLATPYLHDYQTFIDDEIDQQDRRQAAADAEISFDELELATSTWEDRTLVTFGNISGRASDGASFNFDVSNWCATIEDASMRESGCAEDLVEEAMRELDSSIDVQDLLPDEVGMIVVERNGRWYLDWLGTTGYLYDQAIQVSGDLIDTYEEDANSYEDALGLFIAQGPIARLGAPATAASQGGRAGVAIDLTGYPTVADDGYEHHVAVARVVPSASGAYAGLPNQPFGDEDWFVVYQETGDTEGQFPALGALTDSDVYVELFEAPITEVDLDGFSGQFGGQGRPQVFTLTQQMANEAPYIVIDGAVLDGVSNWDTRGVVFPGGTYPLLDRSQFIVLSGEPGAAFSIRVEAPEPEPAPIPEPTPEPLPETGQFNGVYASLLTDFDATASAGGYTYSYSQPGGFFDGCGPDDPDVESSIWDSSDFSELLVLTPFPTDERASSAFTSLLTVSTPCEIVGDIDVIGIDVVSPEDIVISWLIPSDPEIVTYEHYRLSGSNILVASSQSLGGVAAQLEILADW